MLKQFLRFKVVLLVLLMLALTWPVAYARGDDRGYGGWHHGGERHYYREGRWYRHGWFGWDWLVTGLALGALIDVLPPRHTTVIVQGVPYYYDEHYYYRQAPYGGYVVVPPPVLVQPPAPESETVTINVPNRRGGYTPVILRRAGYGYIGPQGEYYSESPTVEQLRVLYGN